MIVAVLGEKGGTGKTTFSTNLAGMRASAGRDVVILDADRQGSSSYWAEKRDKQEVRPVACVQQFGQRLGRTVRDLEGRYDDVVIDIAAGDGAEIDAAMRVATRVVIPVQPAGLDVWTLGLIDEKIEIARAANEPLSAHVVINRASANPKDNDVEEAREAIEGCEFLNVSEVIIRERVSIKRAAPAGLSVLEYKPVDAKAIEEMYALYALTFGHEFEEK